jgi:predicted ATP-grasp superfamily ATP-dependent carboligase
MPPAILLGGSFNAVSVARSLAAAGVPVDAVGDVRSPVRRSRACRRFADLGPEGDVQARWLDWLLHDGARGAVVLPCDDDGVELIGRHRSALTDRGYVAFDADDRVMLDMLDKARTYELARGLHIATPRTVAVHTAADVERCASLFAYPCALKPVHAHRFQRRSGMGVKAIVVRDEAELRDQFRRLAPLGVELLVTEIVPGDDDQLLGYHAYVDQHGDPLLQVTKRKLRQYPVGFGTGCYHVTESLPRVAELGLAFLRGIGARGLANVEFKRDARDGALKLIECNHRFTATNEHIRVAGIDLALFTYNRLLGRATPPVATMRTGVRLWCPVRDVRAGLELGRAGRLSARRWARSIMHRQHLPVFRWSDPGPTLAQLERRVLLHI